MKLIGMGSIHPEQQIFSQDLLEGKVYYIDNKQCRKKWGSMIDFTKMCTLGRFEQNACIGDSGGPLLYWTGTRLVQLGVISFGSTPCNKGDTPVIHANIKVLRGWINNVIHGYYGKCAR